MHTVSVDEKIVPMPFEERRLDKLALTIRIWQNQITNETNERTKKVAMSQTNKTEFGENEPAAYRNEDMEKSSYAEVKK